VRLTVAQALVRFLANQYSERDGVRQRLNRIPVLRLPSDFFATRAASPLLQELEDPRSYDVSVNDTFKPVSRFWDRISRPEQLPSALLAAMRVLTDPAETGAVTLALPQDGQAEAHNWPEGLFNERAWYVPRPQPEPSALDRVADNQAGKGAPAWDHPCGLLPVDLAANAASLGADVLRTATVKESAAALEQARASDRTTVVYIETDPLAPVPSSQGWWDVPVSETSALESTQQARAAYEAAKRDQKLYL
jgi:TPP-dependent trihydroxycyclohexane-1,2-dione (THcHDO) dehydratase